MPIPNSGSTLDLELSLGALSATHCAGPQRLHGSSWSICLARENRSKPSSGKSQKSHALCLPRKIESNADQDQGRKGRLHAGRHECVRWCVFLLPDRSMIKVWVPGDIVNRVRFVQIRLLRNSRHSTRAAVGGIRCRCFS